VRPPSDDTPGPDPIATSRLDLVPQAPDDADEMVSVLAGEELYAFIGGSAPTLDELRERYRWQSIGRSADGSEVWHNWIIRPRPGGQAVGFVQATIREGGRQAEIAWVVGLAWQRRGYATEASLALVGWLDARRVRRITANIQRDHMASEAVARRIGLLPAEEVVDGERVWERVATRATSR
jgi:RimJ/RimL family protein N-acetyltransferase